MNKLNRFRRRMREQGLRWTTLYSARVLLLKTVDTLEKVMVQLEKENFITGTHAITSHYHTSEENRAFWDSWDWSRYGEEWTLNSEWKDRLINDMLLKYIRPNSSILEVGPGAGRWTETLIHLARHLLLADISARCLDICRERFASYPNVEYRLIGDRTLTFLTEASLDYIWSYDVFVHINPTDTERYLTDFARSLKPGGYAIIHHPGSYSSNAEAARAFRSYMDGRFFAHLVAKHGFEMVEQNDTLVHQRGDLISVFMKPTRSAAPGVARRTFSV